MIKLYHGYLFIAIMSFGMPTQAAVVNTVTDIQWEAVPGTKGEASEEIEEPDFWYIGKNTIIRKEDAIEFDVNLDGEYVHYVTNCKTGIMNITRRGQLDESGKVVITSKRPSGKFPANAIQKRVLEFACAQKMDTK
jgi:hypothetical protein